MNPDSSKLRTTTSLRTEQSATLATHTAALEFSTAEEMLRRDALDAVVPETVRDRLAHSIRDSGPPDLNRPWWKRILG